MSAQATGAEHCHSNETLAVLSTRGEVCERDALTSRFAFRHNNSIRVNTDPQVGLRREDELALEEAKLLFALRP